MIIVDSAIKARLLSGRPILVGMYGSGFMARGMLINVERYMKVLNVVAIATEMLSGR